MDLKGDLMSKKKQAQTYTEEFRQDALKVPSRTETEMPLSLKKIRGVG
mgnify:CR=1 FL=1